MIGRVRVTPSLLAISALVLSSLAGGPADASVAATQFQSPDGRLRAVIEHNETKLYQEGEPAPRMLPGYPQGPWSTALARRLGGEVQTAVFSADGQTLAVAGSCRGYSGTEPVRRPRCLASFVQLWDTATGALAGTLRPYWNQSHDESRVVALALSPDGRTVAALFHVRWSDCSFGGTELHLQVWQRGDGPAVAGGEPAEANGWHRLLSRGREGAALVGEHDITLDAGGVVTLERRVGARTTRRVFAAPVRAQPRARRSSP